MKKSVEEIADRQKGVKTVPEYSTKDRCVRTDFKKNYIDVTGIRNKKLYVTRYCFDEKHFSDKVNENLLCDRISKNTFKIDYNKNGYVYVIYKGECKKDQKWEADWWIVKVYPNAKVKEG